jgi:hypothetical protein
MMLTVVLQENPGFVPIVPCDVFPKNAHMSVGKYVM